MALLVVLAMPGLARGQTELPGQADLPGQAAAPEHGDHAAAAQGVVSYPASFFVRYRPNTALEMVRQVPGFQLDDGSGDRGFSASAGNVLINDRRISAKQDPPSAILARLPATHVKRIDLIRGQVRGIDMLGQSVVANVVLRGDVPAATRWEAVLLKNFLDPSMDFSDVRIDVSRSDRWRRTEYNTGISLIRRGTGDDILVDVLDGGGDPIEERLEVQDESAWNVGGNLNLATTVGRTVVRLNTRLSWQDFDTVTVSNRSPIAGVAAPMEMTFGRDNRSTALEVGVDAERSLSSDLIGQGILLFSRDGRETINTQRVVEDLAGQTLLRVADQEVTTTETITRAELDWLGWQGHTVQLNVEGARNVIEGRLLQTDDTGAGPVEVDVPGGNTRVEEVRGDMLLKDIWPVGNWLVDFGVGAEFSEITQTGDLDRSDSFFFIKPQTLLTWSPRPQLQTRLRVAREVSQLNLNDFVTSTQFQDENLLRGGQTLEPESTWVTELTWERRFGELGVLSLQGFYHWISDVQDFVALSVTDDHAQAPGNIGEGRRFGMVLEGTLPLSALKLRGARLDLKVRWQDSTVLDPVTGEHRMLTGFSEHQGPPSFAFTGDNNFDFLYDIAFRQDLQGARVAWGWDVAERGERAWFRIDELNVYDEIGMEVNLFVETTRWLGIKIRLEASNLAHFAEHRSRTVYEGRRDLSPVSRREVTERLEGRRLILTVSGMF